jgi:hypothetical protein
MGCTTSKSSNKRKEVPAEQTNNKPNKIETKQNTGCSFVSLVLDFHGRLMGVLFVISDR